MSLSMRSPLKGVPVWRQASSTRFVGCRWVSMIMLSSPASLRSVQGDYGLRIDLPAQVLAGLLEAARRGCGLDADHPGDVVAQVVLERFLVQVQALWRVGAEHLQQPQPHAGLVGRRIGAEDDLVLRQDLGELDDSRLQAPARFAEH